MAIKKYKPTSPGRRGMTTIDRSHLTFAKGGKRPFKKLLSKRRNHAGRNNYGRITSRFRGGGHKRLYRTIDFRRDNYGVEGTVASIEYDPNRTTYIALIHFSDGDKRYILAPEGLTVGDKVISSAKADIKPGNSMPLSAIPVGTIIHNLEIKIGRGAQLVRSAGVGARLMAREGSWTQIRLPSGEVRRVHIKCRATVGTLSNGEQANVNPVDHPMGGGEGRTSGGRHPVTPWGKPTKGYRTRHNKRTDVYIVSRRKK
jgi:large subunit ribosomal protein L2